MKVLDAMRSDAPDDPFWKGVAGTEVESGGVRVRFHEPRDPRDLDVAGSRVQCHLFDDEALAAARELGGAER